MKHSPECFSSFGEYLPCGLSVGVIITDMFTSSVGIGSSRDSYKAGVEAATVAVQKLGDAKPGLAIVFASTFFTQGDLLRGVQSVLGPNVPLAGASTAGELTDKGPVKTDSVVVMLMSSDTIKFSVGVSEGVAKASYEGGKDLYGQLKSALGETPTLISMFADGLTANPVQIIKGLEDAAGDKIAIVGGSAGDNGKFKQTYQYCNGQVYSDAVVGIGFSGAIEFSIGVRHGWLPIGIPKTVTAAEGTLIKEINGKPAISLYEEYLGAAEAAKLGQVTLGEIALSYPLGVKDPVTGDMLLRAPFFVNDEGGITCGGEFNVGDEVQLMLGSAEEAVVAAKESAERAFADLTNKHPAAAIIYSCHVRNTLYGSLQKSAAEVSAVVDVIGKDIPLVGFYTYAEQAPIAGETKNMKLCRPNSHNETLVTLLLSEKQ